ncbi:hypothetical protein HMPREF3039_01201 [Akkermansia sp. KLE1798]|nr:hypothetical protein HMPREF3039_01201 [Akkermansia sp. KLE1798]
MVLLFSKYLITNELFLFFNILHHNKFLFKPAGSLSRIISHVY